MNYEARYNSDFGKDGPTIDWRSANPIGVCSKLRIFMSRGIFSFWKKKVIANYNLTLEHSSVGRPADRADRPVYQECAPLSHADQMACATGVIEDAVANFGCIRGCQRAAARQLNAADYALQDLLAELVTAMPTVAAETVPQTMPLTAAEPFGVESEPVVAEDDGALAA